MNYLIILILFLNLINFITTIGFPFFDPKKPSDDAFSGIAANQSQFPYIVSIEFAKKHLCSGTILSSHIILSAAHCHHFIREYDFKYLLVRAGIKCRNCGGQMRNVSEIVVHPKYGQNPNKYSEYGVALLKLLTPLEFNIFVNKIDLIENGFRTPTTGSINGTVAGWGIERVNFHKNFLPDILKYTEVEIISMEQCWKMFLNHKVDKQSVRMQQPGKPIICAGCPDGLTDLCYGDSGVPLIVNINGNEKQLGIVSVYNSCKMLPGHYTGIGFLRSWIDDTQKSLEKMLK